MSLSSLAWGEIILAGVSLLSVSISFAFSIRGAGVARVAMMARAIVFSIDSINSVCSNIYIKAYL